MRILHSCLASFYIDGYNYQENILPREHKKLGHSVEILASTEIFKDNNNLGYTQPDAYINEDGIKVTRLPYSKILPHFVMKKLRIYKGVEAFLYDFKPELIFMHDLQFLDIKSFARYIERFPETKLYVDCHADFSNSARNFISKYLLHGVIYKYCAKQIEPYTRIFWGVLPARVDFLINMYKIPEKKVRLLVMGAEDDKVLLARNVQERMQFRNKHKIKDSDFLVVTGGKIDFAKKQTLLLMKAIKMIRNESLKLIIFGSVSTQIREEFDSLLEEGCITYIGWVDSLESYKAFASSDLVVFPGRHSVFWEQAVGLGVPVIAKYWEGTTHIDLGGNVEFLYEDSELEIQSKIEMLITNKLKYQTMKHVAEVEGIKSFSYSMIARKSIELN